MIADKKNNKKVLEEANDDVTPEDLVTLEGEGTETDNIYSHRSDQSP